MQTLLGQLETYFEADQVTFYENLKGQNATVIRYAGIGAASVCVLLVFLGNLPFAIFVALFMGGTIWFIKTHATSQHEVVIDKASDEIRLIQGQGRNIPVKRCKISDFTSIRIAYRRKRRSIGYLLLLHRPMTDDQVTAELPDHLQSEMGKSDLADKLLKHTARGAGTAFEKLSVTETKHHDQIVALANDLAAFLQPEYPMTVEEVHMPHIFPN